MIRQTGAFEALRVGRYDGAYRVGDLTKHGDFGLGTFNGLDGEMIVLDGEVYQIDGLGDLHTPGPDVKTPFAFVVPFDGPLPRDAQAIQGEFGPKEIEKMVETQLKGLPADAFVAIRLSGTFVDVSARSFAPQLKPYQPFAKIMDRQSVFPFASVEGTAVGFRMPKSVATDNLNVPGYHFHFVTADRKHGGHLLKYRIKNPQIDVRPVGGISKL